MENFITYTFEIYQFQNEKLRSQHLNPNVITLELTNIQPRVLRPEQKTDWIV